MENVKLKMFILSELREKGYFDLLSIVSKSRVNYFKPTSYAYDSTPILEVFINNKKNLDFINSNKTTFKSIVRHIAGYSLNLEERYERYCDKYHLNVEFKFDLNEWEDIDISNMNEDVGNLGDLKNKMINRYRDGDYDGCLTLSKTFLETSYKDFLQSFDIEFSENADLPELQKEVFAKIFEQKKTYYTRILNGMKMISMGINETRNKESDGHGQLSDINKDIDPDMVKVIVETSISIVHFIVKNSDSI